MTIAQALDTAETTRAITHLPGVPAGARIAVAMSGGVDSSVVAGLMQEAGYEVVGFTLQLYDPHARPGGSGRTCCAGRDIMDARAVANHLGFRLYVLNFVENFQRDVIDDFVNSYARGETPIPCVRCNEKVKFRDLLQTARNLGAHALVTGHYVQKFWPGAGQAPQLHRARNRAKDQSYFLFTTTPDQLDFLHFPLGNVDDKSQTRALASSMGLTIASKPDSQDICFVPNGDYAAVATRLRPDIAVPGDIVDQEGIVLGRHQGLLHYTIGQRKKIGVSRPYPLYVVALRVAENQVVVGPRSALATTALQLTDMNWILPEPEAAALTHVDVQIRSTGHPLPAIVTHYNGRTLNLELVTPEDGVSPGQVGVLYQGDRVLGGGWIRRG